MTVKGTFKDISGCLHREVSQGSGRCLNCRMQVIPASRSPLDDDLVPSEYMVVRSNRPSGSKIVPHNPTS